MTVLTWHAAMDISSQVGLVLPAPIEGMSLSFWCITGKNMQCYVLAPPNLKKNALYFCFLKTLYKIHSILSMALTTLLFCSIQFSFNNDCRKIQNYSLRQHFRKYFSCYILK